MDGSWINVFVVPFFMFFIPQACSGCIVFLPLF